MAKTLVRYSDELHSRARLYCKKTGLTLNAFVIAAMADYLGFREVVEVKEKVESHKSLSSPPSRSKTSVGRNSPCPCGSGLKYKKCCGK
ncbi:conserved hypothetical protein [uncultured Desulfobacterium sp.]|uniref:Uncharacterized protein n=1 Tax=uncultured Desulfobacterium sp. TaxID=201089 RepID=A0A445N3N0_9BACT|nr:conserved hypothetical protein [uncultured Desulfobacterium sp.]